MPSPGPVAQVPVEEFMHLAHPPRLPYPSFNSFIHHRPPFDQATHLQPNIFSKIICPYDAHALEHLLAKHSLTDAYPHLVHNIQNGFPLGRMPMLSTTVVIPNHPLVILHVDEVTRYIQDEVSAGRMSGPFSSNQVERILRGPFQSSPFIVLIQTQGPGEPDKIRICRHLSKATKHVSSVNSFIEKEDFPTRFDTAARVAEIVSLSHYLCFGTSSPHP